MQWLDKRRPKTLSELKDFFNHVKIPGFDAGNYLNQFSNSPNKAPNIGIAVSGGGYRALLNGAGVLKAFDKRSPNATAQGHLGGLLQSATYLAGLSGGSWLVGSLYMNNFSSVRALEQRTQGSVWEFENSIFEGPDKSGIQAINSLQYYHNIVDAVDSKSNAGFATSLTDYW